MFRIKTDKYYKEIEDRMSKLESKEIDLKDLFIAINLKKNDKLIIKFPDYYSAEECNVFRKEFERFLNSKKEKINKIMMFCGDIRLIKISKKERIE